MCLVIFHRIQPKPAPENAVCNDSSNCLNHKYRPVSLKSCLRCLRSTWPLMVPMKLILISTWWRDGVELCYGRRLCFNSILWKFVCFHSGWQKFANDTHLTSLLNSLIGCSIPYPWITLGLINFLWSKCATDHYGIGWTSCMMMWELN